MRSLVLRTWVLCAVTVAPLLAAEKASPTVSKPSVSGPAPAIVDCPAQDPIASPGTGGMRAAIDPATGKLREMSPEEARKLASAGAALARAPEQFEAVVHSNGMVSVDLLGAFLQDLVARKNPDGSITMECNPHAADLPARTAAPAPSRAPLEEK